MIAANINIILVVTGVLMLGAALVFFVPGLMLKIVSAWIGRVGEEKSKSY